MSAPEYGPATSPETVRRVAVIGAGTIGASWAAYYLARSLDVRVVDPKRAERELREEVEAAWPALEAMGVEPGADPDRIRFARSIDGGLAGAEFVQECVPERLAVKRETLRALEEVVMPNVIVASSTSALLPSAVQAGAGHPERVLAGHPFNPPHLIPLVEVAGGEQTSPSALEWAVGFYVSIGKRPVLLKREAVGHLANRLTAALFREAVHLVAEGFAAVEDIDEVLTSGPGLRWALQGPFTTYHLAGGRGGIAHYMRHIGPTQEARWQTLGTPALSAELVERIVEEVEEMTEDSSVAELARTRDEGLLALGKLREGRPKQ